MMRKVGKREGVQGTQFSRLMKIRFVSIMWPLGYKSTISTVTKIAPSEIAVKFLGFCYKVTCIFDVGTTFFEVD